MEGGTEGIGSVMFDVNISGFGMEPGLNCVVHWEGDEFDNRVLLLGIDCCFEAGISLGLIWKIFDNDWHDKLCFLCFWLRMVRMCANLAVEMIGSVCFAVV